MKSSKTVPVNFNSNYFACNSNFERVDGSWDICWNTWKKTRVCLELDDENTQETAKEQQLIQRATTIFQGHQKQQYTRSCLFDIQK